MVFIAYFPAACSIQRCRVECKRQRPMYEMHLQIVVRLSKSNPNWKGNWNWLVQAKSLFSNRKLPDLKTHRETESLKWNYMRTKKMTKHTAMNFFFLKKHSPTLFHISAPFWLSESMSLYLLRAPSTSFFDWNFVSIGLLFFLIKIHSMWLINKYVKCVLRCIYL